VRNGIRVAEEFVRHQVNERIVEQAKAFAAAPAAPPAASA